MLSTSRLLTFALRALALLFILSGLWLLVMPSYNRVLASVASAFASNGHSIKAFGSHILLDAPGVASSVTIDALTLEWGMILLSVLVLSAVGIGLTQRLRWLAIFLALSLVTQIVGLVLMSYAMGWSSGTDSADFLGRSTFGAFAVLTGLLPAIIGGVWCFAVWLPGASNSPSHQQATQGKGIPDNSTLDSRTR